MIFFLIQGLFLRDCAMNERCFPLLYIFLNFVSYYNDQYYFWSQGNIPSGMEIDICYEEIVRKIRKYWCTSGELKRWSGT